MCAGTGIGPSAPFPGASFGISACRAKHVVRDRSLITSGKRPPPTLQVSLWLKALEEHAQLHSLTLVMVILINDAGNLSIVNFELVICPL